MTGLAGAWFVDGALIAAALRPASVGQGVSTVDYASRGRDVTGAASFVPGLGEALRPAFGGGGVAAAVDAGPTWPRAEKVSGRVPALVGSGT